MKPKKMSLKGIQGILSRDEMKKIMAGSGGGSDGCCCAHEDYEGWDDYYCGLDKSEAQAKAIKIGGKWCCDSCPSSVNPCYP